VLIKKDVQKHDSVFTFIIVLYYLVFILVCPTPPYPAEKNQASQQACQSARLLHATDEKACMQRHCFLRNVLELKEIQT
jgi:hypothetical protein